jgi:hypothetical protein
MMTLERSKMRVPLEVEKEIERQKIAAYVVGHLPIVKAYAIKVGLVDIIDELIAGKMGVEPRLFFHFSGMLGLLRTLMAAVSAIYFLCRHTGPIKRALKGVED